MENFLAKAAEKFRNPMVFITIIVVLTIVATQVFEGELLRVTWGGIVQVFSGLMAIATYFALLRLSRHLSLTLKREDAQEIGKDAKARANLSAGIYIGAGLVIIALWG